MNTFTNTTTEQFGDFSKSTVDAAMKFAQVGLTSTEHLIALNMQAIKTGFDVTARNAKAVSTVKDAQDLNTLRNSAAEIGMEFAMGYSKNFYDAAANAQAQYSALVEERVSQFQKSVVDNLDKVAQSAPVGSDVFIAAIKNGLAASTAATDSISKAAKQATAFADTAFKAATDKAEKATKPASKRK